MEQFQNYKPLSNDVCGIVPSVEIGEQDLIPITENLGKQVFDVFGYMDKSGKFGLEKRNKKRFLSQAALMRCEISRALIQINLRNSRQPFNRKVQYDLAVKELKYTFDVFDKKLKKPQPQQTSYSSLREYSEQREKIPTREEILRETLDIAKNKFSRPKYESLQRELDSTRLVNGKLRGLKSTLRVPEINESRRILRMISGQAPSAIPRLRQTQKPFSFVDVGKNQQSYVVELINGEPQVTQKYTISSGTVGHRTPLKNFRIPSRRGGYEGNPGTAPGMKYTRFGESVSVQDRRGYKMENGEKIKISILRDVHGGKWVHSRDGRASMNHIFLQLSRGYGIHGSSVENKLGHGDGKSHGCVRMSNLDIISFMQKIDVGNKVYVRNVSGYIKKSRPVVAQNYSPTPQRKNYPKPRRLKRRPRRAPRRNNNYYEPAPRPGRPRRKKWTGQGIPGFKRFGD